MRTSLTAGMVAAWAATCAPMASLAEVPARPTFHEHVAPVLYDNCVSCHRPGQVAPMSLLTFEEARPWAKSIGRRVSEGSMPPWHASPESAAMANERQLTPDEVATIVRWSSRPEPGDPNLAPPLPEFPDAGQWQLGQPDLVVAFETVTVAADGPDTFYDLRAETGLTEERWVTAMEVLPGNSEVAHHVIVWQEDADGNRLDSWLGAWAAGTDPLTFPDGMGRRMPVGGALIGDMHYHPSGIQATDQTRIGLHFSKGPVKKEIVNLWIANTGFEIPAGNPRYKARASATFDQDSYIFSLLPHMHYRGKQFEYVARYPDGRRETLLDVDRYDFNWQTNYILEEPHFVPAGTRIDCVATWDNSPENPNNPDSTKTVVFGSESYDEMMIGFLDYFVKDGVRPLTPSERLLEKLDGIDTGDDTLYFIDAYEISDGDHIPGVLRLSRSNSTGTWYLIDRGNSIEAPIRDLAVSETAINAFADVPGQGSGRLVLTVDPSEHTIEGTIDFDDPEDSLRFTGHEIER